MITEPAPAILTRGHFAVSTAAEGFQREIVGAAVCPSSATDVVRAPEQLPFVAEILHAEDPATHVALPIIHVLLQLSIYDELLASPGAGVAGAIFSRSSIASPPPQGVADVVQQSAVDPRLHCAEVSLCVASDLGVEWRGLVRPVIL